MQKNDSSTRELIIEAVLDVFRKNGDQKLTVRDIVHKAGVNVAAVNYYFGSKEKLIEEARNYLIEKLQKTFDPDIFINKYNEEAFEKFLKDVTTFITEYPGVMKSVVGKMMFEEELQDDLENGIIEIAKTFKKIIGGFEKGIQEKEVNFRTYYIMSGLIMPVLLSSYGKKIFGIDYFDEAIRNDYINMLLDTCKNCCDKEGNS